MEEQRITIPLEEYKELLELKGRYLESQNKKIEYVPTPTPTLDNMPEWKNPYNPYSPNITLL